MRPRDRTEIELAPGVIGRFVALRVPYRQYGTCDFSWLADEFGPYYWAARDPKADPRKVKELKESGELRTFQSLLRDYGDYFFHES